MNIWKKSALLAMMIALVCVTAKAKNVQHQNQFAMRVMVANALGGVTNIKEIRNRTTHEVIVSKIDVESGAAASNSQEETIPSRGVFNGDFWIPWLDHADRFSERHLTISVNGRVIAWIWQSGAYVRFNTVGSFVSNARVVPGVSGSGGNRRLIITEASSGRITFRFERFV